MGFPAGFAAAAPFLGEIAAHAPYIILGVAAWDSHTQFFDAANAGEVGKALGPLWIVLEVFLLRAVGRPRWAPLAAALTISLAAAPAIHLAGGLPWAYRWMAWGVGLTLGLALARALDPRTRWPWVWLPGLTTGVAFHAWRFVMLDAPAWDVTALRPVIAGSVAGLVVSVGRSQGQRWGGVLESDDPTSGG